MSLGWGWFWDSLVFHSTWFKILPVGFSVCSLGRCFRTNWNTWWKLLGLHLIHVKHCRIARSGLLLSVIVLLNLCFCFLCVCLNFVCPSGFGFCFVLFCLASFNTSLYYGSLGWCSSPFMVADLTNMLFHYSWLSFVLFCLVFDTLHCFVEVVWTVFVKLIYVLFEFHPALYHYGELYCIIVCLVFDCMSGYVFVVWVPVWVGGHCLFICLSVCLFALLCLSAVKEQLCESRL